MDSTQSMMAQDTKKSPSELYTTFYNDMFVLKATAMISGQPAEIDFSKNDELSLRCHSPELNLCFHEMSTQLGTLLRKYGVCQVNSIWCGAEPFIHVSCSCRHFDRRMHVASLSLRSLLVAVTKSIIITLPTLHLLVSVGRLPLITRSEDFPQCQRPSGG